MNSLSTVLILGLAIVTAADAANTESGSRSSVDEPPAKVVRWFDKATRAFRQDDNAAAIAGFDRVIAAYPAFDEAIYNRALALAEVGRDRDAMADLAMVQQRSSPAAKKLAGLFLVNSMATVSIAAAAIEDGDLDKAEKMIARALVYNPASADAYIFRGVLRNNQNRSCDALADYASAIERDPNASTAHYNRALIFLAQRQYREALADFSRAIELNPADAQSYQGRAQAYAALGDAANAAKDLEAYRQHCDCSRH
jgi:tetratricopeptide (TPR) repeat protein